ncbi:hypothetical protein POM88_012620 [Heracleum sosnowskyi]|uniref:Uncharacterized protein n=1 Tax=Heracleum sosnowskyi TaxID=360622 RepID=A0AAD8IWU7_9APIA|nr:hypothetical protein POM88_012620 [Heracleum sosnowskyi]
MYALADSPVRAGQFVRASCLCQPVQLANRTGPVRFRFVIPKQWELSVLDLANGREKELTHSIELFWVTCGQSEERTNLIGEVSWLDYGHRGMQVWYPSSGHDPFQQEDFLQVFMYSNAVLNSDRKGDGYCQIIFDAFLILNIKFVVVFGKVQAKIRAEFIIMLKVALFWRRPVI